MPQLLGARTLPPGIVHGLPLVRWERRLEAADWVVRDTEALLHWPATVLPTSPLSPGLPAGLFFCLSQPSSHPAGWPMGAFWRLGAYLPTLFQQPVENASSIPYVFNASVCRWEL
jgi:hypothetical protein